MKENNITAKGQKMNQTYYISSSENDEAESAMLAVMSYGEERFDQYLGRTTSGFKVELIDNINRFNEAQVDATVAEIAIILKEIWWRAAVAAVESETDSGASWMLAHPDYFGAK